MATRSRPPKSIKRQFAVLALIGALAFLIALPLSTAWMMSDWLHHSVVSKLDTIVRKFAKKVAIVYLLEDKEYARSTSALVQVLPFVKSVVFLRPDRTPLFAGDRVPDAVHDQQLANRTTGLCWESVNQVDCLAPVTNETDGSPFRATGPGYRTDAEMAGYVYLAIDKVALHTITRALMWANIIAALAIGFLLYVGLRRRVLQMIEPISAVADSMMKVDQGEVGVRASLRGPAEAQTIAAIFNTMIAKFENNKELLESEIAIRTLELREARDAALNASRLKSEFLSLLSHEIRTPMTAIEGHAQIAMRDLRFIPHTEDIVAHLAAVLGSGRDTLAMIDQILGYTRAETGRPDIQIKRVALWKLADNVVALLQPLAQQNHNALAVEKVGEQVTATDEGKLLVIMHNLVANACKYTVAGHVRLHVACSDGALVIQVSDTGIGIPAQYQKAIFEPFHRITGHHSKSRPGVGLGLAITQRFSELLGGQIAVDSREGAGSTFTVTIPTMNVSDIDVS